MNLLTVCKFQLNWFACISQTWPRSRKVPYHGTKPSGFRRMQSAN